MGKNSGISKGIEDMHSDDIYIHTNIRPISASSYSSEHTSPYTQTMEEFQNYLDQCSMDEEKIPACLGRSFGIDTIELTSPIYDKDTGELFIDMDWIFSKAACIIEVSRSKGKNQKKQISKSEIASPSKEFINEYKYINIYAEDIPVKFTINKELLTVSFTPAKLKYGHNVYPSMFEMLESICEQILTEYQLDVMDFTVKKVEYAIGISTRASIQSIVDSLGHSNISKNTKRYPMKNGLKWTNMKSKSSIKVYSTKLKNLERPNDNYTVRCSDFSNPINNGIDSIRIEMAQSLKNRKLTLRDLLIPEHKVQVLRLFRSNFATINKNQSNIYASAMQNIDMQNLLLMFKSKRTLDAFAKSVGYMVIQDKVKEVLPHNSGMRRSRLRKGIDAEVAKGSKYIEQYIQDDHFHDVVLNVLDYYIKYYTYDCKQIVN